ncbi:MAG: methyltransferase domain-containing protein [Burkholderiaceae bacterium]|uniref:class I SAM-dependent methyltransferase n=1 Tax=Polaromonas sp. YR568 TaxID=1855301 RepID=UPI00272561C8|nr:methyltransferase domain-containing protein [Burkholderiaceae bacterium]
MEYVKCDLCSSDKHEPVAHQTDRLHRTTEEVFTVVRCAQCGLHFTNPRPTPAEIGRYYAAGYAFHASAPSWRRRLDRILDWAANGPLAGLAAPLPMLAKRLAARVRPSVTDPVLRFYREGGQGTFLDIGCGAGIHAHFWGAESALQSCHRRVDVAGVEISETARAALTEAGIRCWPDLSSVPPEENFGLIRMNWSLEHVHSPREYFSFIARHLSSEGQAIITVPNYSGLIYRLAPDCVELPVHLYHFRPEDIVAYAGEHGLSSVEVKTFSYPEMFRAAAEAGLLPSEFSSHLGIVKAKALLDFMKPLDDLGWGNDMLVVLKKTQLAIKAERDA